MNRYLLDGIVRDLRAGRTVAVYAHRHDRARHLLDEVAARLRPDEIAEHRKANGAERLTLHGRRFPRRRPGAQLRVFTVGKNSRPVPCDVAVILSAEDADPYALDLMLRHFTLQRTDVVRI